MRRRETAEPALPIPDALLEATANGLLSKHHSALTAREIASTAGTTQGMIKYYFDGKDGLFLALLEQSRGLAAQFDAIIATIRPGGRSPTRDLITALLTHYHANRHLFRIVIDGLSDPESRISREWLSRRLPRLTSRLKKFIVTAQQAGIYRSDLKQSHAIFILASFAMTNVVLGNFSVHFDMDADEVAGDAWIDFLTNMVDQAFREPEYQPCSG